MGVSIRNRPAILEVAVLRKEELPLPMLLPAHQLPYQSRGRGCLLHMPVLCYFCVTVCTSVGKES